MNEATEAENLMLRGYACSQAVLLPHATALGLDPGTAVRVAAPFAAGMRAGSVCGAVTGAFMVLGLALCDEDCVTRDGRAPIAAAVSEFSERFIERYGSVDCPDIIGCDLRTPQEAKTAMEEGRFATRCAKAVRAASEILAEMLPSG